METVINKFRKVAPKAALLVAVAAGAALQGCSGIEGADSASTATAVAGDAASQVYVAPGKHDELYTFMSGGFSGQVSVYGVPSGRQLKVIPVFSQNPENGYGYNEETKAMLNTSFGFVPWDDLHHPKLSRTDGMTDGRWLFVNANNTPRVARLDLKTFETAEILEIPNSAGNHCSPYPTNDNEYVLAGTRFSVPINVEGDGKYEDVNFDEYKDKFRGSISFIKVDKEHGDMELDFQILVPGFDYDLANGGKGPSSDWVFFTTYNTEQANTLKEIGASQNDKDFLAAINWKLAVKYAKEGKAKEMPAYYYHNKLDEKTHIAKSEVKKSVRILRPEDCPGLMYLIPVPKSPHGIDVDPTGEYMVVSGKLASVIPVHSFSKMLKTIENKDFIGNVGGIPILRYESVLQGEVKEPGLGPLHTEFDDKGNAYSSMFVSSEIVKWTLKDLQVKDRIPVYYSVGHLVIPGGDTKKPYGKYLIAMNKITKDRYLPTGPELAQSAQLIDISGDKMKLLLDFPTIGEPHYAQAIEASKIAPNSVKMYSLEENTHPQATKKESEARVERNGNEVHVYMTAIRSHLTPDNIEGINEGDEVYFHVTNLEQDWDVPHGFAVMGNNNAELLIMPGATQTLKWVPQRPGIFPMYCTDFCSALHQEMQGYIKVSPKGSKTPIAFSTGAKKPKG
ncbi:nitrous oxide reductase apoprotein [Pontibacter ummariensis]|uniref:Nitrous oxide reductase apoprotein n=1 Tax=Pontibacter ummariensis TaxID=1610492 RepID=A0A239LF54_9BACT|nr:Sec-dependent nitrous-oxide reductase [Pontibacter ummariensis]PRY03379.1 nitrous oxide reductase apoprotein [Pontibacter ummariensis]SNT29276.1 nitrous oxide reductase apoprotein [Pontibacter ummariensis]